MSGPLLPDGAARSDSRLPRINGGPRQAAADVSGPMTFYSSLIGIRHSH